MPSSSLPEATASPGPSERLVPDFAALHAALLRYARARVRNVALAEDAVSETLLAAWQAQPAFATEAQTTAWVYGILRHKLVDQLRQQGREVPVGDHLPEPCTSSPDWFVGAAWCGMTSVQSEPEQACSHRQFLELVLRCCEQLPPRQRQTFILRELLDDAPDSICRQLDVTEGNLWVLLHRARSRLRTLLREEWLEPHEAVQAGTPKRPRPRQHESAVLALRAGVAGRKRTPRPSRALPAR